MKIPSRTLRPTLAGAMAAGAILATGAAGASAAPQVWWTNATNYGANPGLTAAIARANIDGSDPVTVIDKSTTSYVSGVTVDLWSGKMFYIRNNRAIVSANLDGSNPQVILSGNDVAVNEAWDIVYDRQTDYLYWISEQYSNNSAEIRRARPDGSSSTVLYSQAQLGNIRVYDLTVVPEINRIYWGNYEPSGSPITYANLDGSGNIQGITPNCGGAATSNGLAIAVDPGTDRMFAVIAGGSPSGAFRVRKTKMDGTNCETLATVWSSINDDSMALNRADNELIIGSYDLSRGPIGLWSISDSTPNQSPPASALIPDALPTSKNAAGAIIVEPPRVTSSSASVTGSGSGVGSTLTLTRQDTFAPDEPGIKVYRGVTTKTIAWYRDGVLIPGETGPTLTATQAGTYKAVASATNIAGSVDTASNEVTISAQAQPGPTPAPGPAPMPSNAFTAVAAAGPSGTVASVARVPGAGKVRQVVTRLAGGTRVAVCSTPAKAAKGAGRVRLACSVNPSTRAAQATGRVRVRVRITFTPTGGTARTVTRYAWLPSLKPPVTG